MTKLEIERKWYLYKWPTLPEDVLYTESYIQQIYCEDGRYRREAFAFKGKIEHTLNRKKEIRKGVFEEFEVVITAEEFFSRTAITENVKGVVFKKRYTWIGENGQKWFLDDLMFTQHILLEVETLTEGEEVKLPEFLVDCVVAEVTGDKRFTNFALIPSFSHKSI